MAFSLPSPSLSLTLHSADLDFGNFDAEEAESCPALCLYSFRLFAVKVVIAAYKLEIYLMADGLKKSNRKTMRRWGGENGGISVLYDFRKNKGPVIRC